MKSLRGITFLPCIAFIAALGCGPALTEPEDSRTGTNTRAIIGGTEDHGDPAVVMVDLGNAMCSGTLIGPHTVLTAGHCHWAQNVYFEDSSSGQNAWVSVLAQFFPPNAFDGTLQHDVSVLHVGTVPAWVQPIRLRSEPLKGDLIGQTIRKIGYGIDNADGTGAGIKREGSWPVASLDPYFISSGSATGQICSGDSGGPGLLVNAVTGQEEVAGVTSWSNYGCTAGGFDVRVDAHWNWIRTTMNEWEAATCDEDLQCVPGCVPADVDCACLLDGICRASCRHPETDPDCLHCAQDDVCSATKCEGGDPDCRADFQSCTDNTKCLSGRCLSDSQHDSYCAPLCGTGCPAGMTCDPDRHCHFDLLPERKLGETCRPGEDFCRPAGTICAGLEGEEPQCRFPCTSDVQCPGGEECMTSPNVSDHFCEAPPPPPPAPREPPPPARDAGTSQPEPAISQGCAATGTGGGGWFVASILALGAPWAFRVFTQTRT